MNLRLGKITMNDIDEKNRQKAERRKESEQRFSEIDNVTAEDWERILGMKNTDADRNKIREVRQEFEAGTIQRNPANALTAKGKVKPLSKTEVFKMYEVVRENKRAGRIASLVEATPDNYELVTDDARLREVITEAMSEKFVAVDTETTGLDWYTDVIVGFSLTNPTADRHYYVPIQPTEDAIAMDSDIALSIIKPLIESEKVGKIYHNAIFDINMFERHGILARNLAWDTQTAMILLNENEPSYALKDLATKYLKEPSDTFAELFGKNAEFWKVPLDVALVYAAKDTDLTFRLFQFQRQHLAKMPSVMEYLRDVELPLLEVVRKMQHTGFMIDIEFTKSYGIQMAKDIEELRVELMAELGTNPDGSEINLNSPPQLKAALERATGRTLESTDAKKVLKPMAAEYPVIEKLLQYKEYAKLYGTYISVLPDKIHPKTGRVHVRFNPNGTVTGRFSSGGSSTNIQNQPQSARNMYVSPPGWVIIGGDFSAQEVRCAANKSQEPVLLEAFRSGRDPYATLASEYYGLPYEDCYKNPDGSDTKYRKEFKVVMLAVMYGMGPGALSGSLKISKEAAKKFLDEFFRKYPKIDAWIKRTKNTAHRQGYVWAAGERRKRRLPDARKRGYSGEKARAQRQAPNFEIQGESAIQTKITLIEMDRVCQERGWKLWATIHDEILVLMPETFTQDDIDAFESVMVNSYHFGNVPNRTDVEVMTRWGDGVPVDVWFENNPA